MGELVLVTGGAGFIGSYVVEELLRTGCDVRVYDKLVEQVHGTAAPRYLPAEAQFVCADMNDREALRTALAGVSGIVHLAAEVGVGQSMYEITRYVTANTGGTATLLDLLANEHHLVRRVVVASSMSIYGEGSYRCPAHGSVTAAIRDDTQLAAQRWEIACPGCGAEVRPEATSEAKPLRPTSVYAISKMDQELLCLTFGAAYGVEVTALRYFNTYGPRQALSNPYTGVAAIFSSRLLNGHSPIVFEDGRQRRDFIHVRDVARATVLALSKPEAAGHAINVGVGAPLTILDVAEALTQALSSTVDAEITGTFRSGDIRHCWADPTKARELLGFSAEVTFESGIEELIEWVRQQRADDHVDRARGELSKRGLAR